MAEGKVLARVVKRSHNRVEDGKNAKYPMGSVLLVSRRELRAFPNVLQAVPEEKSQPVSAAPPAPAESPPPGPVNEPAVDNGAPDDQPAGDEAPDDSRSVAIQRVVEAPDVQALRIIAEELGIRVNKSLGAERTREVLLGALRAESAGG